MGWYWSYRAGCVQEKNRVANRQINRELRFGRWSGVVSALRIVIVSGLITFVTLSVFTFVAGVASFTRCIVVARCCIVAYRIFLVFFSFRLVVFASFALHIIAWIGIAVPVFAVGAVGPFAVVTWIAVIAVAVLFAVGFVPLGLVTFVWVACLFDWRLVFGYRCYFLNQRIAFCRGFYRPLLSVATFVGTLLFLFLYGVVETG